MNRVYSKSAGFYKSIKKGFFEANEKELDNVLKKNDVYTSQPPRLNCKLCNTMLPNRKDFEKHNVPYAFCDNCDHLNGLFQDTSEFAKSLYTDDGGVNYAKFYKDDKYEHRLKHIYMPKAEFLFSEVGSTDISLYDFGCGLGHFVECANRMGANAVGGDVSSELIKAGNSISSLEEGNKPLEIVNIDEFKLKLSAIDCNVLSAMAVMEHVVDLDDFCEGVRAAKFDYFYYSVPTYGFSVTFENLFGEVFPRHLSGGHTHLFTEKSRKYLEEKLGVSPEAEWRFGSDILDLRRAIEVTLEKQNASTEYISRVQNEIDLVQDDLQEVIDKAHICSQVHVVCKKL